MANNKVTPFTDGNPWRFKPGNESAKRTTKKQVVKQIEALLTNTEEELRKVADDSATPLVVRQIANSILSGSPICIAEFLYKINSYGKQTRRETSEGVE